MATSSTTRTAPRGAIRRTVDRLLAAAGYAKVGPSGRRSVYAGGSVTRLNADWVSAPLSADAAIRGDLRLTRDRARQLVRDNAYARRAVTATADNVIGADGMRLQCLNRKADGTLDDALNDGIEEAWEDYCLPENCSVDGLLSMTDVAQLAVSMWKQDGESLIRLWDGFDNAHGFAVQVLDADMLDHTYTGISPLGNEVRMGVERNKWGRPLAYWIFRVHPNDSGLFSAAAVQNRDRVDAKDIVHLYTVERPGQTRGMTAFACVMGELNHLGSYQEAELIAARQGAAQPIMYTQDPQHSAVPEDTPTEMPAEVEPGANYILPIGVEAQVMKAEHPSTAFGLFLKAVLRAVAVGWGMSYALLTGDLSDSSYSSMREGKIQERDRWRVAQRWLAVQLYRRVFLRWLKMAALKGRVALPSMRTEKYALHRWLPRGWAWVDPEKDIKAAALEIAYRLNTRTNVAGANGRDFGELVEQIADEEALLAEHDLISVGVAPGLTGPALAVEDAGSTTGTTGDAPAGSGKPKPDADAADDDRGSPVVRTRRALRRLLRDVVRLADAA
jgi:lambda family phage portal protein